MYHWFISMAIGIVNDDELQSELDRLRLPNSNKQTPVLVPEIIEQERPGRDVGDTNVPDSLRKILGETSILDGRESALKLAGMFGVSPSSVSAYAKGSTSTASYDTPKESIVSHLNKSRRRTIKKASRVLNDALGKLDPEKLGELNAKDLSGVAKDMSAIIRNLEPQEKGEGDNGVKTPQFVVFAPQFRDERSFETMVINE